MTRAQKVAVDRAVAKGKKHDPFWMRMPWAGDAPCLAPWLCLCQRHTNLRAAQVANSDTQRLMRAADPLSGRLNGTRVSP